MKWFPRSISGQLLFLWLLAMVAAHVVAIVALSWWRAGHATVHPLYMRGLETRLASSVRAVAQAPDADDLLAALSLPDASLRLAPAPGIDDAAMSEPEQALAQRIQAQFSGLPPAGVRVRLTPQAAPAGGDSRPWFERWTAPPRAWTLDVAVALPDGRWLQSANRATMVPAHWDRVLSFSLLVGLLPAGLIAVLFGRRIMRPLVQLKDASERVSRGERVTLPLPETPVELREITRAFNDMQARLVRFVQGRTQMIAAIGHDLRTALASLRIRAELIDDPGLRGDVIQTVEDMSVMVEETLQFARDDVLHEPLQDVHPDQLVGQVVDSLRLQGHDIDWHPGQSPGTLYRCRPVHLKRALTNVIDNAARHGAVRVGLMAGAPGQGLRIEVEDDGPGIDPSQFEHVFEPFTRLDSARSPATGGSGLGLAIARSSVRAHGGDLTLHNRPQGGLRAVIDLPN